MPFYGWSVVAVATLATFWAGPGQPFVFSVFIDPILADIGLSRTSFSAIYSVATMASAISMVIIGRMVDRYGGRRVIAANSAAMGMICITLGFVAGPIGLILAFIPLRILGQGGNVGATLISAQWFVRQRGRAMMVLSLGLAASSALLPVTSQFLITSYGWRGAYQILGVLILATAVPLSILVLRDRPEEIHLYPDGADRPPESEIRRVTTTDVAIRPKVLTSLNFWIMAVAVAATPFTNVALLFHQVSIFAERGLSADIAAAAFVPFAIGSACATAVTGLLIDRFGPKKVLISNFVLLFGTIVVVLFINSTLTSLIYTSMLGATMGIQAVASRVVWVYFYGRHGLGRVQGAGMMVMSTFVAISPLVLAALQGITGSFRFGLIALSLMPITAAILVSFFKPIED